MTWQTFVAGAGRKTRVDHLAAVVRQPFAKVRHIRSCVRVTGRPSDFATLFAQWRGRPPRDSEWPKPIRWQNGYEWLAPELALLASLVGRMSLPEISQVLTARLRRVTGDPRATRNHTAIQVGMKRIGLQATDVVGGITVTAATREIGARAIVQHEIRQGHLRTRRVGRLHVIPYPEWEAWKAKRVLPPAGFIRLAALRKRLGIRSDKLSEWARRGYVPSAVRCKLFGTGERSTQFGTWYVDKKVAAKILADRRAGRPMPWHGRPCDSNLKATWTLLERRRHPATCAKCRVIWGKAGAPRTFDDYARRYPPLDHGAKRHLTKPYSPGFTLAEVAQRAGVHVGQVSNAVKTGRLRCVRLGRTRYVSGTDAARWRAAGCRSGHARNSWVSLETARKFYGFTQAELERWVAAGRLPKRVGDFGAQRGQVLVLRQPLRDLRDELGYTEAEAARRAKISVARLRVLLRGLEWRQSARIPLQVIGNVIKRRDSKSGLTIAEAAARLGKPVAWVHAEIAAGTIRPLRVRWDRRRRYVSGPMFTRLERAAAHPQRRTRLTREWIRLNEAAHHAAVSPNTIMKWGEAKLVARRQSLTGWRYHRRSIERYARAYWKTVRFKRAQRPEWLEAA